MEAEQSRKPGRGLLKWILLVLAAAAAVLVFTSRPRTLDAFGVPPDQCVKLEVKLSNGYDSMEFTLTKEDPAFVQLLALFQDRKFDTFLFHPGEVIEDAKNFSERIFAPSGGLFPPVYSWQLTFSTADGTSLTIDGCEGRLKLIDGITSRRMGTDDPHSWFCQVWDAAEEGTSESLETPAHWNPI